MLLRFLHTKHILIDSLGNPQPRKQFCCVAGIHSVITSFLTVSFSTVFVLSVRDCLHYHEVTMLLLYAAIIM